MSGINPTVLDVTDAIIERSRGSRGRYVQQIEENRSRQPERKQLSCGNLAHGVAA